jgi:undecaprenyl phosphate-alpha-L-ara4N flippase subunit ArnF
LWCAASVLLVTFAQLTLKMAVSSLPSLSFGAIPQIFNPHHFNALALLFCGLLAYAISMLCWFFALQSLPLSHAYPLLSISYVLVYLLAAVMLWPKEQITAQKTAGVALVFLGVWLAGSSVNN